MKGGDAMPLYITYLKLIQKGAESIKEAPQRVVQAAQRGPGRRWSCGGCLRHPGPLRLRTHRRDV
jgi:hypothetical protein